MSHYTRTVVSRLFFYLKTVKVAFFLELFESDIDLKKTNIEVIEEVAQTRSLVNWLRKRQAAFIGHIMTMDTLKHFTSTGKLEGRQVETWGNSENNMIDSLNLPVLMNTEKTMAVTFATTDRGVLKDAVVNAVR